uniref:Uncharacterized protein n=1 Tax=Parascaris equorum TaxID=6256 RepID=A0A914RMN8_PAREQ
MEGRHWVILRTSGQIPVPPPPPPPTFLNSALQKKAENNTRSPTIFKAAATYRKTRATNTINWEAVKPEVLIAKTTVWSDQSGTDSDFSQYQRDFVSFHSYYPT